jgi:hypothetical protein
MKQTILTVTLIFSLLVCSIYAEAGDTSILKLDILSSKSLSGTAGDFVTVDGEITNQSNNVIKNITTYISLVNTDAGMPVDLEDWSAEKGLFIGEIDAGQKFPLHWKIHFVQPGNYTLTIVADIEKHDMPVTSRLVYFKVNSKRNLNPGNVLPVALGEPVFLVFVLLGLKYYRKKKH